MSMQQQQEQPSPVSVNPQSFSTIHPSSHASIGPVIAVLVVIVILGIAAVMIGRMCSGRRILGYGQYDIEGWAETKCSTCIDGRIAPSPPPPPPPLPQPPASTDTSSPPPPPLRDSDNATSEEEETAAAS
ncbi:hypothetical protein LINPERPRIM_LOCUS15216 [Linum perenne]